MRASTCRHSAQVSSGNISLRLIVASMLVFAGVMTSCLTLATTQVAPAFAADAEDQQLTASAETASSGTLDGDLTWSLQSGTLTISGKGAMCDFKYNGTPWANDDSITKVVLSSGVTSVGNYAFAELTSLKTVVLPDGLTRIGDRAFAWCDNLTSCALPSSVTEIGEMAFCECPSLTEFKFPSSVNTVSEGMFAGCSSLASFSGPGVISIKAGSFQSTALTSFTFAKSTTSIAPAAFYLSPIRSFAVEQGNATLTAKDGVLFSDKGKTLLMYPPSATASSYTAPTGCTTIAEAAFLGNEHLTSVDLNGVQILEKAAFQECGNLENVNFGKQLTTVGESAFARCSSLGSADLPDSVTLLGYLAFCECSNLTSASCEGIKSIPYGTFSSCSNLEKVVLGNKLTSIAGDAFASCYSLASLKLPESVIYIGKEAFPYDMTWSGGSPTLQEQSNGSWLGAGIAEVQVDRKYDYAYEVLEFVNEVRQLNGLDELHMDEDLLEAAMLRAAEISVYYNHIRPNCTTAITVSPHADAENIAYGQGNAYTVMSDWENSPGHFANIMNEDDAAIGVGCVIGVDGSLYWVQLFSTTIKPLSKDCAQPQNRTAVENIEISDSLFELMSDMDTYGDSLKSFYAMMLGGSFEYTGKPIEPTIVVHDTNGNDLTEGTDYVVTYLDNVKVGTGYVTIRGLGVYAGLSSMSFTIYEKGSGPNENPEDDDDDYGDYGWERLWGNNALETMKRVVEEGNFKSGGTVVLASVEGYWDALTAAGIAGLEQAPVVMTASNSLSEQAANLLKSLKPTKIIVCGGKYSVSEEVEKAARSAAGAKEVVRASGSTAIDTAIDTYKRGAGWSTTAIVATVGTYHDALAAAPLAYAQHMPIFLASYDWSTGKGTLSKETLDTMKKGGINSVYIAGGTYWISDETIAQLKSAGIVVLRRLSGNTAVETSIEIAREATFEYGMSLDKMGVATTATYYDALAGAALCGKNNSVLLLAANADSASIADFVPDHADEISSGYVFGGSASVSDETMYALQTAIE